MLEGPGLLSLFLKIQTGGGGYVHTQCLLCLLETSPNDPFANPHWRNHGSLDRAVPSRDAVTTAPRSVSVLFSYQTLNTSSSHGCLFHGAGGTQAGVGLVIPANQFSPGRMNRCLFRSSLKEWDPRDSGCEGCGGWVYIISLALHLPPQCMKQGKQPRPGTLPLSPVSPAPTPSPLSLWEEPPLLAC